MRWMMVVLALALVFVLVAVCTGGEASADEGFSFGETDKQAHLITSSGLTIAFTKAFEPYVRLPLWERALLASACTMALGTSKELFVDRHYSPGDQVANLIGSTASGALAVAFEL